MYACTCTIGQVHLLVYNKIDILQITCSTCNLNMFPSVIVYSEMSYKLHGLCYVFALTDFNIQGQVQMVFSLSNIQYCSLGYNVLGK